MSPAGFAALGGLFGAIAGSFLATIVLRWPAGRAIAQGRSQCDGCGRTLRPIELIPLVSHLLQRGRCRTCGAAIDPLHGAVEAVCVLLGMAALWIAPGPAGFAGALLLWMLVALALLDWRHFWLPDRLTLPLIALGLAAALADPAIDIVTRLIGAAAGYLALTVIAASYRALRGRTGLGAGDAKLMAAIGAWLGWRALPIILLAACVIGIAILLARMARGGRVSATDRLPLGTLLAVAAGVWWLVQAAASRAMP